MQPVRHAFRNHHCQCWICGGLGWDGTLDVHEIARGAHRAKAVLDICNWIATCRDCHEDLGDYSIWPIVDQYALKYLRDPEYYDRVRINALRGRAPDAISEEEVREAIKEVQPKLPRLRREDTQLRIQLSVEWGEFQRKLLEG